MLGRVVRELPADGWLYEPKCARRASGDDHAERPGRLRRPARDRAAAVRPVGHGARVDPARARPGRPTAGRAVSGGDAALTAPAACSTASRLSCASPDAVLRP